MGYTNCNPCDPCGTSQSAAKAAAYARQALTSATNAENSWLEFNALYLGAFAVAPAVDNEGNPLQVGALYWNLGSNTMFVWNGTTWVENGNFDEFTNFMLPSATPIPAANLVTGHEYEIAVVGTTNWTAIGAASATVGVRFTKNAVAATGNGTARVTRDLVTRFADVVNVKDFGAVGDGVTNDTAAIQAAVNLCSSKGGGIVLMPPTGAAYLVSGQISLPNGVVLMGQKAGNFNGATGTIAQWTNKGTWIQPTNTTNSCIRVAGHGAGVSGLNFIHNQPIPSGAWSPTVYGWTIEISHSHTLIEDICIVNAYNGIWFNYTPTSGGGTFVRMRDVIVSAFNERLKTTNVNDSMYWSNIYCRNLWYSSNSDVVSYIRANTIGWRCGYTDNIIVDGLALFEDRGIFLEDGTTLGNTHSLYNATLTNVQFNLNQRSISCASTTVTAKFKMCNVVAQQGNAFGLTWSDRMFSLESDNIEAEFTSLLVNDAGGEIMRIGNGTGGKCFINGLSVRAYSTIAAGQNGFGLNANSKLSLQSVHEFNKPGGSGARISGSGMVTMRQAAVSVYPTFSSIGIVTGTGTGTWIDISTSLRYAPSMGYFQARLVGKIYVSTPQVGGTLGLRLEYYGAVSQTGIDASSIGWKNIDTNIVDISGTSELGRLQFAATSGVEVDKAEIDIVLR